MNGNAAQYLSLHFQSQPCANKLHRFRRQHGSDVVYGRNETRTFPTRVNAHSSRGPCSSRSPSQASPAPPHPCGRPRQCEEGSLRCNLPSTDVVIQVDEEAAELGGGGGEPLSPPPGQHTTKDQRSKTSPAVHSADNRSDGKCAFQLCENVRNTSLVVNRETHAQVQRGVGKQVPLKQICQHVQRDADIHIKLCLDRRRELRGRSASQRQSLTLPRAN